MSSDRKLANYKVIIETLNGTGHFPDLPVYATFLGPTGQSSSERLLKRGFEAGYDAIVVNAEVSAIDYFVLTELSESCALVWCELGEWCGVNWARGVVWTGRVVWCGLGEWCGVV